MIGMLWLGQAGPKVRLLVAAAQLTGLGLLIYLGVTAKPTGPAVLSLLAVASLAWIGWAIDYVRPEWGGQRLTLAVTVVLGVAGGLLAGLSRAGYAVVFPSVAAFAAGTELPGGWSLPVLGAIEAAMVAGSLAGRPPAGGLAQAMLIPALVFLAGVNRRLFFRRKEKEVETAALAERARIAREIHDVLAHALAGLSVQLEAARVLLAGHDDPGSALVHIESAQRQAAEGMIETRRAIAALREDARPLAEQLTDLVERHRATTGAATLAVRGTPRPLPPQAALAVYRTAQEALTNAARHAPGSRVEAELAYAQRETVLTVIDHVRDESAPAPEGGDPGNGYGLTGMTERAELSGGTLRAAAFDGGWRVELRVPA